jgi:hypothetical protein
MPEYDPTQEYTADVWGSGSKGIGAYKSAYQSYLAQLSNVGSGYLVPGQNNPGVTPKEGAYFDVPGLAKQSPYGSPAEATQFAGGGPRTSYYFGPSGIQYDTLSDSARAQQRTMDAFNLQRQFADQSYGKYRDVLDAQGDVINQGFEEAYGYAGKQGQVARKTTLDREKRLAAEISARSGGRGYAADYARRGLADQTSLQLAAIQESTARLYSSLALGRTNAQANVLGNIAQSYTQQADDYYAYLSGEQNSLGGQGIQAKGERDYSGLYDLAGAGLSALGYFYGGPAAAAGIQAGVQAVKPQQT